MDGTEGPGEQNVPGSWNDAGAVTPPPDQPGGAQMPPDLPVYGAPREPATPIQPATPAPPVTPTPPVVSTPPPAAPVAPAAPGSMPFHQDAFSAQPHLEGQVAPPLEAPAAPKASRAGWIAAVVGLSLIHI